MFLHAPLQARLTLAMAEYGFTERDAAEVVVRESDAARAKFVRALTGKDWCDATLYDVTLDTDVAGHERVADLLVDLVQGQSTAALPPVVPRSAAARD